MGKATIIPGGNPNRAYYKVNLIVDYEATLKEIELLRRDQDTLDATIIPDLYVATEDAYYESQKHQRHLQEMIKQEPIGSPDNIYAATTVANNKYGLYLNEKHKLDAARAKSASLQTKIDYLRDTLSINERLVWCADCTKNLSGDVATMEIPGTTETVMIRPGYEGEAEYYASRDGLLRSTNSMSPYNVFYSFAMLPGWQKWKPTYRIGRIQSIDRAAKTAWIILDQKTSEQNLSIDPETNLARVPLTYKDQEDAAYGVGNRVVIEFIDQDYRNPRVIGFEQEPCTTTTTTTVSTTSSSTSSCSTSSTVSTTTTTPPPEVWFKVSLRQNAINYGYTDLDNYPYSLGVFRVTIAAKNGGDHLHYTHYEHTEDLGGGVMKLYLGEPSVGGGIRPVDPDGYWIFFDVRDDPYCPVSIQYPFIYDSGDYLKDEDLISGFNSTTYDLNAAYYKVTYNSSGLEEAVTPGSSYIKYAAVVSNLPYTVNISFHHYGGCYFPAGIWRCPFTLLYPGTPIWIWPGKYCCNAAEHDYADTIDCLTPPPSFELWGDSKASRWEIRHSEDPGFVRVIDDSYTEDRLYEYSNSFNHTDAEAGTVHNIIKLNAMIAAPRDWTDCHCPCGPVPGPGCPPAWVLCDECSGGECSIKQARRDNNSTFITVELNI